MMAATKTHNMKLMADYDCFPLWEQTEAGIRNIDPSELPISPALRDALDAWAKRYDDILDRDDPRQSGFRTMEDQVAFENDGRTLLERLKMELGESYNVHLRLLV